MYYIVTTLDWLLGICVVVTILLWLWALIAARTPNPYGGIMSAIYGIYGIGITVVIGVLTAIAHWIN